MTPNAVRAEVTQFLTSLAKAGLTRSFNNPVVRPTGVTTIVASPASADDPFTSPDAFGSIEEYRRLVLNGHYSCLLRDGSLLQIAFEFRRDDLVKHRLSLVPCPIVLDDVFLQVDGDWLEIFDGLIAEEGLRIAALAEDADASAGILRLRSTLRFDYDTAAHRPDHPCSHVHLSQERMRWAVLGPLSLGHFVRFVFRHFFPDWWAEHEFLRDWPVRHSARTVTEEESHELYVDCVA